MGIRVQLLGRFAVQRNGLDIPAEAFHGRLVRLLVRVLVSRRGTFVSRDALIDLLWPETAPADPALNLNVLVTRARKALGDAKLIVTGSGGYWFAAGADCTVDAETFREQVESGRGLLAAGSAGAALRALEAGLCLWGEPLPEDASADWAQGYRRRLAALYQDALETAAAAALASEQPGRAAEWAAVATTREPLREACHLLAARAASASGDTAGALGILDSFRRRIADVLGLDPTPAIPELEQQILRGELAAPRAAPDRSPSLSGVGFSGVGFMGRQQELASALTAIREGGIVVVTGPSGRGKSRLLGELADRCSAQFARPAIAARATPSGVDEPFDLARQMVGARLRQHPEAADRLPPACRLALGFLVPEAGVLSGVTHEQAAADDESRRALAGEGALRILESAGACLLAIDDLQWGDASSLSLVQRALDRAPGLALAVACRRDGMVPGSPAEAFLAELPAHGRAVVRLELGGLRPSEIAGAIAEPDLAACATTDTDATPMAVTELLRELAAAGAIRVGADGRWFATPAYEPRATRAAARRGQAAAIEARIARLPAGRAELLALASLLGREAPARLLARAAGRPEADVLRELAMLQTAELARAGPAGIRPAHDLVAQQAVERLPQADRARLHLLLAGALGDDLADPAEIGRHLAGAGDAPGAAEALAAAAHQRLARFAHAEAERVASTGLDLIPSGPSGGAVHAGVRAALLECRAEARARTGDLAGARQDLRTAARDIPPGAARARLLTRMALLASGSEDLAHAGELVELALVEAGDDTRARASALAVAAIIDMNAAREDRARERSEEALGLFREAGDSRGIADILDGRAMATFMAGDIRAGEVAFDRVARLFADSGDLLRVGTPRSTRGHALVFLDRPGDGLVDIRAALQLARELGHREGEAYALWHASEALAGLGRAAEALEAAQAAEALARELGHREWTAAALRGLGIAYEAAGDLPAAAEAFAGSLAAASGLGLFLSWASARLALVLVAQGRLEEAGPHVARALAEGPRVAAYEAQLAQVALGVARGDPGIEELRAAGLRHAQRGGHLLVARMLESISQEETIG